MRMPTLYVPHGAGPCFFMDWDPPDTWKRMGDFLRGTLAALPARPSAIVVVSSHWEEPVFTIGAAERPGMLFDYRGFPPHTYRLAYPAPGSPALAARIGTLLSTAGLSNGRDETRGYDHGVFVPLMLIAPDADIPVVPLSLKSGPGSDGGLDVGEHDAVGRALQPLRDDGVLIVGSGMSFHNMRGYRDPRFGPVSDRFDGWLDETVGEADPDARAERLAGWSMHPDGRASHPREEHLLPLMVVAGAGGRGAGRRVFGDRVLETTVSAYRFD